MINQLKHLAAARVPCWSTVMVGAAMLVTTTATAVAAEGAGCIADQLGEQGRADFFVNYRAGQTPTGPLLDQLRAASDQCSRSHGWTEAQVAAARRHTVARILYEQLRLNSPYSADDLDRIGTQFDTVDPQTRQRWVENGISGNDEERMLALISQAGVAVDTETGVFVGEYFAARHLLAATREAFDAS